jgi:hypothetical protein
VPTLSDRVSDLLGQAVIAALVALVGTVIFLWVTAAGLRSDVDGFKQDYVELHDDFREFRKPGARYTSADGARDRADVEELKHEFHIFRDKGSRATDAVKRMQKQLDDCEVLAQMNRDNWHDCGRVHGKLESELFYLRKLNSEE